MGKRIGSLLLGLLIFAAVSTGFWFGVQRIPAAVILRLDNAGIVLGYILSCLTVAIAPLAWLRRTDIRRWFYRTNFDKVGLPFDVPEAQVACTVIPVSNADQPEWILTWLKPQRVSFLYTAFSRKVAAELARKFSQAPHNIRFFPDADAIGQSQLELGSADDLQESKRIAGDFLRRYLEQGIGKDVIFVDTTGGKVPMSIGAFQAAEELGISSFYVVGTEKGKIKPQKRESGFPVFISDRLRNG
ncbi:MAG: hypothetical protein ACE5IY_23780 [bacterium]